MRVASRSLPVLLAAFTLILCGCGNDPGGELISGTTQNNQLPIAGSSQALQAAYALFRGGGYTAARQAFLTILNDSPTTADRAEALAGTGFSDVRLQGSQNGIAEFQQALTVDSTNQNARVGLAGALISRGAPTDILNAISLIEGIDPGNPNFVYVDRYGIGITNAQVHALLAYALFVSGNQGDSNTQLSIATQLDPNFANNNVGQIINVISFIP